MDSEIQVRYHHDRIRQYTLIGLCNRRLHYNMEIRRPPVTYFGPCVYDDRRPQVVISPGDEVECIECLTSVCSLLRKNLKHEPW
jgi:hypothetical protein